MVTKKKIAFTTAATFGAAMTSMFVAPELQADIVDITFNGGNASNVHPGTALTPVDIDQVVGASAADFSQWNDTFGGTGRTATLNTAGGIASWTIVQYSQTLVAGALGGTIGGLGGGSAGTGGGEFDGTGTAFIGFTSTAGNVGWFQLTFEAGAGSLLQLGPGEYGSDGESVRVGGTNTIPEPAGFGALAALALGATGVRRNRKKK